MTASYSRYNYTPSFDAAVVVAVLYSLAFAVTVFQWVRYRAWVWLAMVIGAASKLPISLRNPVGFLQNMKLTIC